MGQGEEDEFDAGISDELPVEGLNGGPTAIATQGKLGVQGFEGDGSAGSLVSDAAEEDGVGIGEARVCEEKTCELAACVAADSSNRGLKRALWLLDRSGRVRVLLSQCIPRSCCTVPRPGVRRGR